MAITLIESLIAFEEYRKALNAYNPNVYLAHKKITAEEWNAIMLSSFAQGNRQEETLEKLINGYLTKLLEKVNEVIETANDHESRITSLEERTDQLETDLLDLDNRTQQAIADLKQWTVQELFTLRTDLEGQILNINNALDNHAQNLADIESFINALKLTLPFDPENVYPNVPTIATQEWASERLDDKLNVKPDGTNLLIDWNNKLNMVYIPDVIVGQLVYGGGFNGAGIISASMYAPGLQGMQIANIPTADFPGFYFIAMDSYAFAGYNFTVGDWAISQGAHTPNWIRIINTDAVSSVNGKTGAVVLNKEDIGLGNVANLTPADMPLSTAAQNALAQKVPLNASDKIPSAYVLDGIKNQGGLGGLIFIDNGTATAMLNRAASMRALRYQYPSNPEIYDAEGTMITLSPVNISTHPQWLEGFILKVEQSDGSTWAGLTVAAGDFIFATLNTAGNAYVWHAHKQGGAGSGGTNNYNDLINKPQIEGITLIGNRSLNEFGIITEIEMIIEEI